MVNIDSKKLLELIDKVDDKYCEVRPATFPHEKGMNKALNDLNLSAKVIDRKLSINAKE